MFTPTITPVGLVQEIACRMFGSRFVAANDIANAFRDLPAMQRVMNVLLNLVPGQVITQQELNTAMSELLTACNRKTDNNPNLNPPQKGVARIANNVYVSMVYDTMRSNLRIVAV